LSTAFVSRWSTTAATVVEEQLAKNIGLVEKLFRDKRKCVCFREGEKERRREGEMERM
jgi:hypothetical protein